MKSTIVKSTVLSLAFFSVATFSEASASTALSEMTAAEIISLLPESDSSVNTADLGNRDMIQVSGHDLLTKAYGTVSAVNSSKGTIRMATEEMNLTPSRENDYLWVDSAEGYNLEYKGMSPDVSALVRLENDSISDYGFFFLFPYDNSSEDQAKFSLTMLEDFEKMGIDLGANAYTSDMFEVSGDYSDNYMAMRLINDPEGERYILFLSVEPNAISEADRVAVD